MDGEIDVRKVTVSHFLIMSVCGASQQRWVSFMWPGFVGTLSGINESGIYCMENAGGSEIRQGPLVSKATPVSWIMKEILETQTNETLSIESVNKLIQKFKCNQGGACAPGSIIIFAKPYEKDHQVSAFLYEADRFGGEFRKASQGNNYLIASNHFLQYGTQSNSDYVFGKPVAKSSLWRYEAAYNLVESWSRIGIKVGIEEMKRCLQTVCSGTTEHSIIFLPNKKEFYVALASMRGDQCWDAPYLSWTSFHFNDVFKE